MPEIATPFGLGEIEVYDGLDSTSIINALSANQGRVLNEKITNIATAAEIDAIFA